MSAVTLDMLVETHAALKSLVEDERFNRLPPAQQTDIRESLADIAVEVHNALNTMTLEVTPC